MTDVLVFVIDVALAGAAAYAVNWLGARMLGRPPDGDGDGPGGGWWRRPIPPPPRPHGTRSAPPPHTDAPAPRRAPLSGGRIAP